MKSATLLIIMGLLALLAYYAILYGKLFEFLLFIVMCLQLELAYRQWWLEKERSRPRLVARIRDDNMVLVNAGSSGAVITSVSIGCGGMPLLGLSSEEFYLQPGDKRTFSISIPYCPHPEKTRTIIVSISYLESLSTYEKTAYFTCYSHGECISTQHDEIPGLLTRIPNLIYDFYYSTRIIKRLKSKRKR